MYSAETDVQVGKQNAEILKKRLPLCNAPKVDEYLTKLGLKLVAKLPTRGVQYPWEFHCVNSKEINAFALPGGYVFVNRGAIEVADNEAQLAAVMAHELSHVALRHGTAQASKAQLMQGAARMVGGIFGGSTGGALLTQGVALGAGGLLLRYSRSDETQADVLGTQALYDAGYDPRAMAQFFEKLEAETKGKNPPQFLSDHPNPGHRVERVDEEIGTQALIQELAETNPALKVTREPERVQLNEQPGLSTYLSNDSPAGGQETDWLVTVLQPQGLVSFLCVAPKAAYPEYEKTFTAVRGMLRGLEIKRRRVMTRSNDGRKPEVRTEAGVVERAL